MGGQYGEGALVKAGKTVGYYNTIQASYGLQAGLQKYGYVLFLMTDSAVKYINKSDGWEIGVGPTITIVDEGVAGSATSTTLKSDIYAFFLDQKGLMAGLGLQGTKISKNRKIGCNLILKGISVMTLSAKKIIRIMLAVGNISAYQATCWPKSNPRGIKPPVLNRHYPRRHRILLILYPWRKN